MLKAAKKTLAGSVCVCCSNNNTMSTKIISVTLRIFIFLLPAFYASGQLNAGAYSIGDKFPSYKFNVVDKDSSYKFTLDSYRGKAVIIDLWDIHCSGCIGGLRKLDSLQKLFPDKLKIILVTKNSMEQVEKLYSKKIIPRPELLSVESDTALYETFFPHDGDPLNVWVDESGIIKYITGGYNTTFDNITRFLNKEKLAVAYQTKLKDFNSSNPLIEEAASRLKFYTAAYSLFTAGLQNIVNTNRIEIAKDDVTGKPYLLKALNTSRLVLYQLAYNTELYGFDLNMFQLQKNNRVILGSTRADSLKMPEQVEELDTWKNTNSFCYELFLPLENSGNFFKWMQQDLQRFFNLTGSIKLIKSDCLILTNIKKGGNYNHYSVNTPILKNISERSELYEKRQQMITSIKELIYLTQNFNLPFVDETNVATNVLIKLPSRIKSIKELNSILAKYGLLVKREIRKTKFLIIK